MNLPLRIAFRYLFARKSHNVINIISGIGVAGMAIGTAALIIILSVFNGFNALVSDALTDADPDIAVKPAEGKFFVPDAPAFDWLYDNPSVLNMSSVLEEQAFLTYGSRQSLARVKGLDSVAEEESPLAGHIVDGRFLLHRGQLPRAVVGAGLAHSLGLNPRFTTPLEIHYPDREAQISLANPAASLRSAQVMPEGVMSINAELDASLMLVPIEVMREVLGTETEVSSVEIRLVPGTDVRKMIRELSDRLGPEYRVLDRNQQNDAVYKMMRYEKLAIYLILIFVVVIIAFNIFSSLTMLIIEKQGDIQTLRSLGATPELTRRIFLLEGWLVSLTGLAAGLVIGLVFVWLQARFGFIKMPGSYILAAYPVVLKGSDILWTALGVALVGYLIAWIPSKQSI